MWICQWILFRGFNIQNIAFKYNISYVKKGWENIDKSTNEIIITKLKCISSKIVINQCTISSKNAVASCMLVHLCSICYLINIYYATGSQIYLKNSPPFQYCVFINKVCMSTSNPSSSLIMHIIGNWFMAESQRLSKNTIDLSIFMLAFPFTFV